MGETMKKTKTVGMTGVVNFSFNIGATRMNECMALARKLGYATDTVSGVAQLIRMALDEFLKRKS